MHVGGEHVIEVGVRIDQRRRRAEQAIGVVQATPVALTNPYSDGLATISLSSADVLNWMTCRPADATAELSVELNRLEICDNAAPALAS